MAELAICNRAVKGSIPFAGSKTSYRIEGAPRRIAPRLANFFRGRGYNVKLTPRTGDYGVDLHMTKDGRSTVVQAKCWKGKVGVKAVQEVGLLPQIAMIGQSPSVHKADDDPIVLGQFHSWMQGQPA